MMRMFLSILSMLVLISSCNKPSGEQSDAGTFSVSVTGLEVTHERTVCEISVESASDWAVYATDKTWITLSPDSGMPGEFTVEVEVSANKDAVERTASLVFMYGAERLSLPVVQAGDPAAVQKPDPGEGGGDDSPSAALPEGAFVPAGYELYWSDEFDGNALDRRNWTCETGRGYDGWGNWELQYYTDREENVAVRDGHLVITARKESYNGADATSARLITLEKVYFKYGYVVASIMLPKTANGLWPAFWMMGNDFRAKGWPNCGETDILEMGHSNGYNGRQETFLNGACHWGAPGHQYYAHDINNSYSVQDGQFHTFTCIWTQNKVAMYIDLEKYPDVKPYFEMNIKDFGDNEFRKDNFILLNLAVGGNFPGIWDIGGITALAGGPAEMKVDYVRVFQKK